MNLKTIQKVVNSNNKYNLDLKINKITTNSKEIEFGDLFLTINSGYLYVDDAIKNGAVAIITDRENLNCKVPVLIVKDTKLALKNLASYYRNLYKGTVIAITGSNGKTTTKELLSHVLAHQYLILKNLESKNNILGISNTLLQLDNSYDYLIVELGMNHKGEITELSNLLKPDIGIITNIGSSHIGNLGSRENIFKAKMEILEGNSNMDLFVNGEDEYLKTLDAISVSQHQYYQNVNSVDASLVYAVSKYLGLEELTIKNLIKSFSNIDSRMRRYNFKKCILIDDAYNASYESFIYGLNHISEHKGRKIIVFGDMLELGIYSLYYHQKVFEEINKLNDVFVVTIGKETTVLNNAFHFLDLEDLKKFFIDFEWRENDLVYLKGAHCLNLSSLVLFFKNLH